MASQPPAMRSRNVGVRRVRVTDLEDAPWNFRVHPQSQRDALAGAIAAIGFFGTPEVFTTADGKLCLVDGHLRKSLLLERFGAETEIDVCVTDFTEAEAKFATLTKDPLAAMAEADSAKLDALLRECEIANEDLAAMLTALAEEIRVEPTQPEDTSPQLNGMEFRIVLLCKDEKQQTALLKRFAKEGLECRALIT